MATTRNLVRGVFFTAEALINRQQRSALRTLAVPYHTLELRLHHLSFAKNDTNTKFKLISSWFANRLRRDLSSTPLSYPSDEGGKSSKSLTKTIELPIFFHDGYFTICFGPVKCIFSYWTNIGTLLQTMLEQLQELNQQDSAQTTTFGSNEWLNLKGHGVVALSMEHNVVEKDQHEHETSTESNSSGDNVDRAIKKAKDFRYRLASTMPLGYAFSALDPSKILLLGHSDNIPEEKVFFQFKFNEINYNETVERIVDWSRKNPTPFSPATSSRMPVAVRDPKKTSIGDAHSTFTSPLIGGNFSTHELMFLEQEKVAIKLKFDPLQAEFQKLIDFAKAEANRRFKWGGLFLLSAQLGFVGRLTWFEYSWDIMEPVTWMLTYAMMVGTFAYYLITSEEYLVPMVEKRMIVASFWKQARATNFDVIRYRTLKDELQAVEKQLLKIRSSGF